MGQEWAWDCIAGEVVAVAEGTPVSRSCSNNFKVSECSWNLSPALYDSTELTPQANRPGRVYCSEGPSGGTNVISWTPCAQAQSSSTGRKNPAVVARYMEITSPRPPVMIPATLRPCGCVLRRATMPSTTASTLTTTPISDSQLTISARRPRIRDVVAKLFGRGACVLGGEGGTYSCVTTSLRWVQGGVLDWYTSPTRYDSTELISQRSDHVGVLRNFIG